MEDRLLDRQRSARRNEIEAARQHKFCLDNQLSVGAWQQVMAVSDDRILAAALEEKVEVSVCEALALAVVGQVQRYRKLALVMQQMQALHPVTVTSNPDGSVEVKDAPGPNGPDAAVCKQPQTAGTQGTAQTQGGAHGQGGG